jgi:hypothetical protein
VAGSLVQRKQVFPGSSRSHYGFSTEKTVAQYLRLPYLPFRVDATALTHLSQMLPCSCPGCPEGKDDFTHSSPGADLFRLWLSERFRLAGFPTTLV